MPNAFALLYGERFLRVGLGFVQTGDLAQDRGGFREEELQEVGKRDAGFLGHHPDAMPEVWVDQDSVILYFCPEHSLGDLAHTFW